MAGFVVVRPQDHLVMGVLWNDGCTVAGSGASAHLVAGAGAQLTLVLPPQHVGEETSLASTAAPTTVTVNGTAVGVWRGELASSSRLVVSLPVGTQVPLTSAGVLAAALGTPLATSTRNDTAIELPYRLVIAPKSVSAAEKAVLRHRVQPGSAPATALWRTRVVNAAASPEAALLDSDVPLTVIDEAVAGAEDPEAITASGNTVPLARSERGRLFAETARKPARATRLELSTIGGSLDATGRFPNFEWDHHAVLGRDMHVRTLAKGAMYPFGHRAEYLKLSQRVYDPAAGGASVLRTIRVLTIVEPRRSAPQDGPVRRAFPLGDIEVTRLVTTDLAEPVWQSTAFPVGQRDTHFWPTTSTGARVLFPVSFWTSTGEVKVEVQMLFVNDLRDEVDTLNSPVLARRLADDYGTFQVPIKATNIDLAGSSGAAGGAIQRAKGDVHEVRSMVIAGYREGLNLADGYRSRLDELEIALPALRTLLGEDPLAKVKFGQKYLQDGVDDLMLTMPSAGVPIDFTKASDRSGGLLAPKLAVNAISRTMGAVDQFALPNPATGFIDPQKLFPADSAALLGFPLKTLLKQLKLPPEITVTPMEGSAPRVDMRWTDVKLGSVGPFVSRNDAAKLDLSINVTPPPLESTLGAAAPDSNKTICTVHDFALELPPGSKKVLSIFFESMTFDQQAGKSPKFDVAGVEVTFLGDLTLLKELAEAVDLGDVGKLVDVQPSGLAVRYSIPLPSLAVGAFAITNMAVSTGIEIPFDGKPVRVLIGFASRISPFQMSVMMFGGGGYIELALTRDGLERFEAALEFGAFVALDFVVASGEVHALGGVRFVLESDGSVTVTGYLRIGGSVSVLGLISVSIELCLSLTYQSTRNALVGRATLVIEIDLTLWSESVELDSGEWVLAGDENRGLNAGVSMPRAALLQRWRTYRAAFVQAAEDLSNPDGQQEIR